MTEREALTKLIEVADIFDEKTRHAYLENLENVSDQDVHDIGVFLATYLKAEVKDLANAQEQLKKLIPSE